MKNKKEKSENSVNKKSKFRLWIKAHKVATIIISIILIIAIVVGGVFIAKNNQNKTQTYSFIRTTTLSKGSLADSVSTTGTVNSADTSSVTTSLQYTVKSINVAVGDTVKKGDVICSLDTTNLQSQIDKETTSLSKQKQTAQLSYDSAKTNYDTALTNYNDAKSDLASAKTPYQNAYNSVKSYINSYNSAMTSYENAGANLVKARTTYNSNKTKTNAQNYVNAYYKVYGNQTVSKTYDISDTGNDTTQTSSSATNTQQNNTTMNKNNNSNNVQTTQSSTQTVSNSSNTVVLSSSMASEYLSIKQKFNIEPTTSSSVTLNVLVNTATNLKNAKISTNYTTLKSTYDSANSTYDNAKSSYQQCKTSLTQASNELNNISYDNLDTLKEQLEECDLKAEVGGTVTTLNATVGSMCNGAVATIQNTDSLIVNITIDEADINTVKTGLSCKITTDATDETLDGKLTQIDPITNDQGSFGGEVTVSSKNTDLHIGMNASVEIVISSTDDVYQVPIDAVGNDDTGDFIYRQTGGSGTDMTFEKVYVTTGEKNDYYIEVTEKTLADGDVIRSSSDLTQGIEEVESNSKNSSDMSKMFGGMQGGRDQMGGDFSGNGGQMQGNGNFTPPSGGNMQSNSKTGGQ